MLPVLDAQETRKVSARRSVHSLEALEANVLATTMNNIKKGKGFYYYEYRYE